MPDLTPREAEILALLKNEPMISQESLAERLEISRSAAAVHISNLIKKGAILGRGYVFNERTGITVAGAVCFRTVGQSPGQPQGGKTVGAVGEEISGIAFQIACRLASTHAPVRFMGVVGRDEKGDKIVAALNKAGVDTAQLNRVGSLPSAQQMEIHWPGGSCRHLDRRIEGQALGPVLNKHLDYFRGCDLLVLDRTAAGCLGDEFLVSEATARTVVVLDDPSDLPDQLVSGDHITYLTTEEIYRRLPDHSRTVNLVLMRPQAGVRLIRSGVEEEIPCLPGQGRDHPWSLAAFGSGLLSGISNNLSLRQSARLAMKDCSGENCHDHGRLA